ncbi:MAG: PP2C family protein-serine/threonine phosphatase [Gammaproteobacteria bacterium]
MRFESAEVSLLGDREENQDRAAIQSNGGRVFLVLADGMGGHSGGAVAAEVAVSSLCGSFANLEPGEDWGDFLRRALEAAHDSVVLLGNKEGLSSRPRATCAICIAGEGRAMWAHVGDSRVYLARGGAVVARTRDHTPIESMLQDGLISEEEIAGHPMRHYVEYCLGGIAERPLFTISGLVELAPGDLLLLCSDGLWSGISDADLGAGPDPDMELAAWLVHMASRAVRLATPHSDNTSALALRVLAD